MSRWALRSNQKYGKKGSGKRMTATVKAYLEGYFLAGNVNKTDRMSAKDMVIQLQDLAKEGEIQFDDIPEIKTVEGWIARYSANLRKNYAAQRVAENNISGNRQNETLNQVTQPYNNNNKTNLNNTTNSVDSHRNAMETSEPRNKRLQYEKDKKVRSNIKRQKK